MPGESYDTFRELKLLAANQSRRTVGEIMRHPPISITADTTIKVTPLLLRLFLHVVFFETCIGDAHHMAPHGACTV